MSARLYVLSAIAAVVVVGGLYLWLDARSTGPAKPSATAVAEAQARHAQAGVTRPEGGFRRPPRADVPDVPVAPAPPVTRDQLPHPRVDIPGTDPAAFAMPRPRIEPTENAVEGVAQPPIDPDNPEIASAMTEANKAYDRGDYEGARAMALKLLGGQPDSVRMLRVVVSSSCIMGDAEVAQQYWAKLPPADQAQMSLRCSRYQVGFPTVNGPAPVHER